MTRDQRKGIKRKKFNSTHGKRKGRHSKKDKFKNKQERIANW